MEIPQRPRTTPCPWQQLFARYEASLRYWIRLRLARSGSAFPEDAVEDLLQDIYCRLLQRHGPRLADLHTDDARRLTGYLATVARHSVIDFVRYQRAQKRGAGLVVSASSPCVAALATAVQARDPSPEQQLIAKQGWRSLCYLLAGLAPQSRVFRDRLGGLLRTVVLGWTSREAERSAGLGLSAGAINTQLHRLRDRARAQHPEVVRALKVRGSGMGWG